MSILKIEGPQFEATIDFATGKMPFFLEDMRGMSLFTIVEICYGRGWNCSYTDPRAFYGSGVSWKT